LRQRIACNAKPRRSETEAKPGVQIAHIARNGGGRRVAFDKNSLN